MASFGKLFGWEGMPATGWTAEHQAKMIRVRMDVEREIRAKILGKDSGLSEDSQVELRKWEQLFNWEAHRGLLTNFKTTDALISKQKLSLVPDPDDVDDAMFLNRSTETNPGDKG